jgi:hypothetical protein
MREASLLADTVNNNDADFFDLFAENLLRLRRRFVRLI